MNINVRIRRFKQRQKAAQAVTVPTWAELSKLDEGEARTLAERLGVEWVGRMGTLSEINKLRG